MAHAQERDNDPSEQQLNKNRRNHQSLVKENWKLCIKMCVDLNRNRFLFQCQYKEEKLWDLLLAYCKQKQSLTGFPPSNSGPLQWWMGTLPLSLMHPHFIYKMICWSLTYQWQQLIFLESEIQYITFIIKYTNNVFTWWTCLCVCSLTVCRFVTLILILIILIILGSSQSSMASLNPLIEGMLRI